MKFQVYFTKRLSLARRKFIYYDETRDLFVSFAPLHKLLRNLSEKRLNAFCDQCGIRHETLNRILKGSYMPSAIFLELASTFLNDRFLLEYDHNLDRLINSVRHYYE